MQTFQQYSRFSFNPKLFSQRRIHWWFTMGQPLARLLVLGPFELNRIPGHPAARASATDNLGQQLRRKTRALLAYLAATHEPVRREALTTLFFPNTDDPQGALRWQLSTIRRQIGATFLISDHDRVHLDHTVCWIDADAFEHVLDHSAALSIEEIVAALSLHRGEYLAGLNLPDAPEFDLWLLGRQAYYRQRYEQALSSLVERLIGQGRTADAVR